MATTEELADRGKWDRVRRRITKKDDTKRIVQILYHVIMDCRRTPPDDIVETLVSKVKPCTMSPESLAAACSMTLNVNAMGLGPTKPMGMESFWTQDLLSNAKYFRFGEQFWKGVCGIDDAQSAVQYNGFGKFHEFHEFTQRTKPSHFRLLVKKYVEAVKEPIPFEAAVYSLHCLWEKFPWKSKPYYPDEILSFDDYDQDLRDLWEKIILLIRSCQEDGFNKSWGELCVVHHLIAASLPQQAISIALHSQHIPIDALLSEQDSDGRTPLHWVAMHPDPHYRITSTKKDYKKIKMILEAYPQAVNHRDKNGDFPLSLLMKNASSLGDRFLLESAEALVDSGAPLNVPNNNNMLPFVEAAARGDLCLTFLILCKDPSVVAAFEIQPTDREVWLTDKLSKAQTHNLALLDEINRLREENKGLRESIQKQGGTIAVPPAGSTVPPLPIYNLPTLEYGPRKRRKISEDQA